MGKVARRNAFCGVARLSPAPKWSREALGLPSKHNNKKRSRVAARTREAGVTSRHARGRSGAEEFHGGLLRGVPGAAHVLQRQSQKRVNKTNKKRKKERVHRAITLGRSVLGLHFSLYGKFLPPPAAPWKRRRRRRRRACAGVCLPARARRSRAQGWRAPFCCATRTNTLVSARNTDWRVRSGQFPCTSEASENANGNEDSETVAVSDLSCKILKRA